MKYIGFTLWNGKFVCMKCFEKEFYLPAFGVYKSKTGSEGFFCCECRDFYSGLKLDPLIKERGKA